MTRLDAQQLLDHARVVDWAEKVQAVLDRLAGEIGSELADAFPLVLAVMGGAVVFTGQLLPRLGFRWNSITCMSPATAARRKAARWSGGCCRARTWSGRNVLVLDDILDEGETLAAMRGQVARLGRGQVWSAVLTDKDTWPHEADTRRFCRAGRTRPLCVRLRHGRLRAVAQSARHLRFEGGMKVLGIIGGTGLTQLANLEITHRQVVRTPYGEPSGALTFGTHLRA